MPKKIKIIFSLSLMMNVLLVGVVLGGLLKNHHDRGHRNKILHHNLSEIIDVLPEAEQPIFKKRLSALMDKQRVERNEMRHLRREIVKLLRKNDFDKSLFEEKINAINQLRQAHVLTRAAIIRDMAGYLNVKERMHLANLLIRPKGRSH